MKMILLAALYGTLVGGELARAPYAVKTATGTTATESLAEQQANALGYKLVMDEPPTCTSNEYAVATGWSENARIVRVYEKRVVVPQPRKWTPRSIKVACGDKWPTVKAALVAVDMFDEFVMSQVIDESCESFAAGYALACEKFGKATVDEILNRAEVEP